MPPSNRPLITALGYAWQFGYTVVVPLVLFGLGGRWLDDAFGTAPWLFLAGLVLAVIVSSVALVRKALKIFRDATDEESKVKSDKSKSKRNSNF